MLLFARIKRNEEAQEEANVYECLELFHSDTWNPTSEVITTILFQVKGKNYRERQSHLRDLAIEFQTADTEGLSWGEFAEIQYFFDVNAKRYGLTKEFRENGII